MRRRRREGGGVLWSTHMHSHWATINGLMMQIDKQVIIKISRLLRHASNIYATVA